MRDIQLHPAGFLQLADSDNAHTSAGLSPRLEKTLVNDWRAGLILLAGTNTDAGQLSLASRFWRSVAAAFLTCLCHRPPAYSWEDLPLTRDSLDHLLATNPPMPGGEYLNTITLTMIWDHLNRWTKETLAEVGTIENLLSEWAPTWQRVGRVTFHLAETKQGTTLPFAFLATFTTGLGTSGRDKHLPLQQALRLYAGNNNRAALVKLLTPIQEAAGRLEWVQEMMESGAVYKPTAWTAEQAHKFLESVEEMELAGLSVRIPDWWHDRPRPQVQVSIDQAHPSRLGAASLLEMNVQVMLGGEPLAEGEIRQLLSHSEGLVLLKGRWVDVDRDKLREVLDYWNGVAEETEGVGLDFHEGLRLLAGAPADLKSGNGIDPDWTEIVAGKNLRGLLDRLRNPGDDNLPGLGSDLKATLRPYQQEGLSWLYLLTGLGFGACLADDMGLGKTLQVLALLSVRKRKAGGPPSLLMVPASLLGNWRAEASKFTPKLRLAFLHTSLTGREEMNSIAADPVAKLDPCDLVVTTYTMAHRLEWLAEQAWDLVILDEAQAIKNHGTRQSKAVKKLRGRARIAMTGTPVENRLSDLWSLFDFLNPGLLGSAKVFKGFIKNLEETGFEPLRKLVGPYILRRLKTDKNVISDLPEKTETLRYCHLTKPQIRLYAKVVKNLEKGLASVEKGIERRGLVLGALMRLKQVCNHPSQLSGDGQFDPAASGKFARLGEICGELAQRQEKVLIFTQYREIIPHLEEHLAGIFGRPGLTLHGGTTVKRRAGLVEEFQKIDGPPFFVISLKAGGTGLNLTAACHVIHFDRWWNPAVENQATDRAFRIGQKQNVLVHKFVTTGTVEEKIDKMISDKKALAEEILGGEEIKLTEMSDEQLLSLVRLDINTT